MQQGQRGLLRRHGHEDGTTVGLRSVGRRDGYEEEPDACEIDSVSDPGRHRKGIRTRSRRTDMGHEPVQVLLQHPVVVQAEVAHELLRLPICMRGSARNKRVKIPTMQARTVIHEEGAQVGGVELAFGTIRPEDDRKLVAQVVRARPDHRILTASLPENQASV